MATNVTLPLGRLADADSWTWFYNRLRSRSNNFGSAKVLEKTFHRRLSDGESDSGYAPSSDCKLRLHHIPSPQKNNHCNMADAASHDDGDDEDEEEEEDICEEEEAAEIHHSIETIVEGLLGSTLDDASVDRIYYGCPEYESLFPCYHNQLVEAIKNLSHSLRRALHSIPHENGMTPTAAHAALKCLINSLISESQELPYLQIPLDNAYPSSDDKMALIDIDIFCSYEGLVASAIINKVVEETQMKYAKDKISYLKDIDVNGKDNVIAKSYSCDKIVKDSSDADSDDMAESFSMAELPLECVQIEEVEEITQEYTDTDDDEFSSISHESSKLQSADEQYKQRFSPEVEPFYGVQLESNWKTPFPEFGTDLVDDIEKLEDSPTCYSTLVTSWENNWLFRKKKNLPLYNSIKYQLLMHFDEPPCMLIPYSSENGNSLSLDDLSSELSETHSVGSLEISSDTDISDENFEKNIDDKNSEAHIETLCIKDEYNSEGQTSLILTPETEAFAMQEEVNACRPVHYILKSEKPKFEQNEDIGKNILIPKTNINKHSQQNPIQQLKPTSLLSANTVLIPSASDSNIPSAIQQVIDAERMNIDVAKIKVQAIKEQSSLCSPAGDIMLIPTQPGSIAEREHKKWLNAVPLKNNPYSAENLSRRFCRPRPLSSTTSSFDYDKFPDQNVIKKPLQTKLDCGLKSIDESLYKRDYYVNGPGNKLRDPQKPTKPETPNCDSFGSIPEEALNSLEEKIYIGAGKLFTLENHVKRLEREVKDINVPNDCSYFISSKHYYRQKLLKATNSDHSSSESDNVGLPSVKILATKFNSSKIEVQDFFHQDSTDKSSDKREESKTKKSRPCIKVHSLTARSLSREFRDRAKQNIPKPMNRLLAVPPPVSDDTASEQESSCNPVSATHNDVIHGYTSDESSTSTSSLPRTKVQRQISQSILKRAHYWDRRVEHCLLSDSSVKEDFPPFENIPN